VRVAVFAALLLSAGAAALPPPPPPPPSAALDREVEGHNLARLFDDYRYVLARRISQRMANQGAQLLAQGAQPTPSPRDGVFAQPRSITFEVNAMGSATPYVRAVATEFCSDSFEVSGCQWIYAQAAHGPSLLGESDFDAEAAARQVAAAGIAAPAPGERYPDRIADVIDGSVERITSAFSVHRLTSQQCPALNRFTALFRRLTAQVDARLVTAPRPSHTGAVEHGPWLKVTFKGPMLELTAYSGFRQPEIVGESWSVLERAFSECSLTRWPIS
jgi:hypothetical protein